MGEVDVIRLSRPDVLNALNGPLIAELHASLEASAARVVVLTGQGSSFCAGGDRRSGIGVDGDVAISINRLQRITELLRSPDRVSICAVEGWAVGGGMELAVACDLIVSAVTGKFRLPDVAIGAGLTGGSTWLLPRIVGVHRFNALVLGEVELDAQTALDWGIVTRLADTGHAEAEAVVLGRRVAAMPAEAVSAFKRVASSSIEGTLDQALAAEAESVARTLKSSETFHYQ
jgi:2-(1,2-epoxy-1,2-dihydrophenyl)acetyl-CoA isomerase